MKIEQESKFQPITITLETKDEAIALWDAIQTKGFNSDDPKNIPRMAAFQFLTELSDWFSNEAQLGGR